jgi:hypothetical protein
MKRWLFCFAFMCSAMGSADDSFAQGTDVGISGVGSISVQPVDDTYVGSPYLSEGIGGVGPGFGAGVGVIFANGFVVAAEYSIARFETEQSGRLVAGEGNVVTTRLRDSLLSGLAGYATTAGSTRVQILGGVSAKLDLPTIDGVEIDFANSLEEEPLPFALTAGVDILRRLSERASLVIGARYSFIERHERVQYLGIGPHVLRAGAGIRVRLN